MDELWKNSNLIHRKNAHCFRFLLIEVLFCLNILLWSLVFGSIFIGSGSPRAEGFGRPGSLRVERFGGSVAFGPRLIGPGSVEMDGSAGRETFRWNGSGGPRLRADGPTDRKAGRRKGQRAGKPSGETVWRSGGLRVSLHRTGTREDGTVHRVELLSSRRFDGMGVFGSPDQRTERLKTDRSRRRQEGSSEHAARTPRPSTWRLHLFQHSIRLFRPILFRSAVARQTFIPRK